MTAVRPVAATDSAAPLATETAAPAATDAAAAPAAETAAPRVRTLNVANALTGLRLVLVPVFLLLLFAGGGHDRWHRVASAVAFAVASATDRFDGQLARARNEVTAFGALADPIADKALTGSALLSLSALGDLPWAVTAVVLVRELGITALRFAMLRHGVMPASRGGKLKTLLQGVAILMYLLPLTGPAATARAVVLAAAVVVTVVTGVDYVHRAAVLRSRPAS